MLSSQEKPFVCQGAPPTNLAIDGDAAIACAYAEDDGGSNAGAAYLLTRSGGVWSQQARLLASNGDVDALFGRSPSPRPGGSFAPPRRRGAAS